MKKISIIIALLFIFQITRAQVQISGKVFGENNPISFVTVVLKDSSEAIKTYDITDETGNFSLETDKGNYTFEIAMLGFETWKKQLVLEKNLSLGEIILESATQTLGEVTIKAKVPLIERKPDRLIFNVSESLAATGGDAIDALRAAPGLNVENDAINMIGKGAAGILINGRILRLSGEEMIGFLNSISAEDIQKIEIITNPPAKYEAANSGGLVNIIFKKGVRDFWKNSTTLSATKNNYEFGSFRNNFFYNKEKIKVSGSVNGKLGASRQIETWETYFSDGNRESVLDSKKQEDSFSGRVALDYDLSKKTTVGVQYLGNFTNPDRAGQTITNLFNPDYRLDSLYQTDLETDRIINSQSFNLHLNSQLDTNGRSVSFDLDYFDFDNTLDRYFTVETFDGEGDFLNTNLDATNLSKQTIDNFSAKIDFEHPISGWNLSYGAKVSMTKNTNDLRNFNNISGEPVFDTFLSNRFQYQEDVQAVYLSGSKSFSEKLSVQGGLRLENTMTEGFSETLEQTHTNDYLKLFPTFYASYVQNQNSIFSTSYGRRINRPWFRNLNPFRIYSNTNNYSEGNPFLQPSFSDHIEVAHVFKQALTTVAYFTRTTNGSGVIFSADNETNVQAIIRQNYFSENLSGFGAIYTFNKISWWESQNQIFISHSNSVFDNEIIDATPKNGTRAYISTNNTFLIGESTRFQMNFFYSSKRKQGLSEQGDRYGLSLGLRQNFLDKKLQLSLYANDIFNTSSTNNMLSEVNRVEVNFGMNYSRRFVRFTATYNFGNRKINVRERKFGNADESGRAN